MKKIAWVLSVLLLTTTSALSCDVCGCAASSQNIGIIPVISKNLVGVGYQWSRFHSEPHHGETSSDEEFKTYQLWGRWNTLGGRLHVYSFLPYRINKRWNGNKLEQVSGIGDVQFQGRYFLINQSESEKVWRNVLQLGLGIKLPTGKFNQVSDGIMVHPNMQAGTGSFDKQLIVQYNLRYRKMGGMYSFQYTFNGVNEQHLRFGNKLQTGIHGYTWFQKKNWIVLPQLGVTYEQAAKDKQGSTFQEITGGYSYFTNAGIDVYYNQFGLLSQLYIPTKQNLGEGNISSSPRLNLNFIYSF